MTKLSVKKYRNTSIKQTASSSSGTTLVELMVGVVLIGVIAIGFVGVFGNISKAVQFSKYRSLAFNLSQEKMQILKEYSFDKVLVTTTTQYIPNLSPSVPYDVGYYPPESILEGGVQFTRYTFVEVIDENSGSLTYLGAVPDTGMKAVTITTTWLQGTELRKYQVRNIVGNINSTMNYSVLRGHVYISPTSTGIQGALVTMAENVGFADFADATGSYQINLLPGTYTMNITAKGFFSKYLSMSVAPYANVTQDISLVPMSSGTIQGTAWINNHLVISQVVGSAMNTSGFCQEYVELFNPTTYTMTVPGNFALYYQRYADASPTGIIMTYSTNTTISAGGYFLFANTTTITMGTVSRTADAVYSSLNAGYPDLIYTSGGSCGSGSPDADSVGLSNLATSAWADQVGWTKDLGTHTPRLVEGTGIMQVGLMQDGQQYVRRSSTSGATIGIGRAYDSGDNNNDMVPNNPALLPPRNSSDIEPIVSGVPAIGAYVTATDGLSQVSTVTSVGTPPCGQFQLTSVATGTCIVFISSSTLFMEVSSVTVAANATTYISNSLTVPAWPLAGYNSTMLSSASTQGYITGHVRNVSLAAISPSITVSADAYPAYASTTDGFFLLPALPGTYDVLANYFNPNSLYVYQTSHTVVVTLGEVTPNVDFVLSQGGKIRGFCTRDGVNPLPGVVFTAVDSGGVTRDQEVSGSDGRFLLLNLSTGIYTVAPTLDLGEVSSPINASATVVAGTTVDASTFTITGSFGSIHGSVTASGQTIRTGVVVICSTMTLASGPSALSNATLTAAPYYITNSYEDGTYILDVRGSTSTTYNMYAYYPQFNGNTPFMSTRTVSGISVLAGQTTSGVNFAF